MADGPQTVTAIAGMLGVPAVNVSHHLNVLRTAKLLAGKKQGRFVFYALRPGVLAEVAAAGPAIDLGCCQLLIPGDKPAPDGKASDSGATDGTTRSPRG